VNFDERERYFERYAMQAEKMYEGPASPVAGLSIDAISEAIGLPREDGREIARHLQEIGWARLNAAGRTHTLQLTLTGHREIAKLLRPAWTRWIDKHPLTMNAVVAVVTGIVAGVIYTVITYYLLK
jgi:hypothetical protein